MDSSLLNNREIAIIAWLIIAATLLPLNSKFAEIKKSLIALFKALMAPQLLKLFIAIFIYFLAVSYIIFLFTVFNVYQVKNMILWLFIVGLYPLTKQQDLSKDRNKTIFQIIKDSIVLTAFIEFISSAFPFGFLIEFFIITPISIFIGGVLGYTANGRDKTTHNFTLKLASLIGLGLIAHSAHAIYTNYTKLDYTQLGFDFSTPIIATILYIPFLYFFATYLAYERCLSSFQFKVKESDLFAIKKYALLTFRTDIELLERWSREIYGEMTLKEATQKGRQVREIRKHENNPPPVRKDYGWSPYLAKNFLEELEIKTNGYHESYGEWRASSSPVPLDNKLNTQNTIEYYVYGSKLIANTLRITICVYNPNEVELSRNNILHAFKLLFEKATQKKLPKKIERNILNETTFQIEEWPFKIKHEKEKCLNSISYSLQLSIQCNTDD